MLLPMGNEIKITVIGPGYASLYDTNFTIHDHLANPDAVKHEYNLTCHNELKACTELADRKEGRSGSEG